MDAPAEDPKPPEPQPHRRGPQIDPARLPPSKRGWRPNWWAVGGGCFSLICVLAIAIPGLLSTGCIVEGTPIDTPSGPRAIEDLREGDLVTTRSGEGRILRVLPARSLGFLRIVFDDGGVLCATAVHPIATPSGWMEAGTLAPGSAVVGREGMRTVASVDLARSWIRVYDLEVSPDPTFVAGGVVVHNKGSSERNASTTLKYLSTALSEYRANDLDGNRINEFWVGDIASLYLYKSSRWPDTESKYPIIELSVALADVAPLVDVKKWGTPGPKWDYYYAVIPLDEEGKPYDEGNHGNTSKFGLCAFPAPGARAKATFIINENNTVFRKFFEKPDRVRIRKWPSDEELKSQGWSKVD